MCEPCVVFCLKSQQNQKVDCTYTIQNSTGSEIGIKCDKSLTYFLILGNPREGVVSTWRSNLLARFGPLERCHHHLLEHMPELCQNRDLNNTHTKLFSILQNTNACIGLVQSWSAQQKVIYWGRAFPLAYKYIT